MGVTERRSEVEGTWRPSNRKMGAKGSMADTIAHEATQRTYGSRGQETKWTVNMDDLEGWGLIYWISG